MLVKESEPLRLYEKVPGSSKPGYAGLCTWYPADSTSFENASLSGRASAFLETVSLLAHEQQATVISSLVKNLGTSEDARSAYYHENSVLSLFPAGNGHTPDLLGTDCEGRLILSKVNGVALDYYTFTNGDETYQIGTRPIMAHHLPELLEIWHAAADTLAFVYRYIASHNDFKPSNLIVTPNGRVVLLDYEFSLKKKETFVPTLTDNCKNCMGTDEYLLPQKIFDPEFHRYWYTPFGDTYSFAVSLFWSTVGRFPQLPNVDASFDLYRHAKEYCPITEQEIIAIFGQLPPKCLAKIQKQLNHFFYQAIHEQKWQTPDKLLSEYHKVIQRALHRVGIKDSSR